MKRRAFLFLAMSFCITSALAGGSEAHWSYSGEDGPEHWGKLSDDYSICAAGQNQSPVDLVADYHVDLPELVFEYHGSPLRETNNGHTIQISASPGNFLEIPERGQRYEFQQGHFHSPSEHSVDGRHYPMEIHLVHRGDDDHLTVVGIMIEEGEEHPMLTNIWAFMPERVGETTEAPVSVFEAGVLPPTHDYFTYSGSLTTPPCSEGVRWIVLRDTLTVSAEQIQRFKDRVGEKTNRPIQPHNARVILD